MFAFLALLLDFIGSQLDARYRPTLRAYERAVRSRNALLKSAQARSRELGGNPLEPRARLCEFTAQVGASTRPDYDVLPASELVIEVNRIALACGYTRYIDINPFIAGVCTMGFIFGAYLSETFRGAFMAIPKGQAEAGAAACARAAAASVNSPTRRPLAS